MDEKQLTRLFEKLLQSVTAPTLFGMLEYAMKGSHPMMVRKSTPETEFTTATAKALVDEVKRIATPAQPPVFRVRD